MLFLMRFFVLKLYFLVIKLDLKNQFHLELFCNVMLISQIRMYKNRKPVKSVKKKKNE